MAELVATSLPINYGTLQRLEKELKKILRSNELSKIEVSF